MKLMRTVTDTNLDGFKSKLSRFMNDNPTHAYHSWFYVLSPLSGAYASEHLPVARKGTV